MPENWGRRTRQLLTCRCAGGDVAALDAKYTKELADAKAEMMLCVMMPLAAAGLLIVPACQSVRSHYSPPGVIMQPPPDWQTPLNGIISPSERG